MCRGVFLIFAILSTMAVPVQGSVQVTSFRKLTSVAAGTTALNSPWPSLSLPTCVTRCLTEYSSTCMSVIYHSDLHLCTPGSTPSFSLLAPDPSTEGELFASYKYCDTTDGFSEFTSDDGIPACLLLVDSQDYTTNSNRCQNFGGYLAVPKTLDKLLLLQDITSNAAFIGLTDLMIEGIFVWADDNSNLTSQQISNLFYPGEPSNVGGEDCVTTNFGSRLNDVPCSYSYVAICERPMGFSSS